MTESEEDSDSDSDLDSDEQEDIIKSIDKRIKESATIFYKSNLPKIEPIVEREKINFNDFEVKSVTMSKFRDDTKDDGLDDNKKNIYVDDSSSDEYDGWNH